MSIYKKKHYWGHKEYNTKTGLYKGETRWSTDGTTRDWKGRTVKTDTAKKSGMGANGYDD